MPLPSLRANLAALLVLMAFGCGPCSAPPSLPAELVAGPAEGRLTESGEQVVVPVRLSRAPEAEVHVEISSSDEGEATVSPSSLTFTADNWNAPQQVLVTGVNDDLVDGDASIEVVLSVSATEDAAYKALQPTRVALVNIDDETAGATVTEASGPTTEAGGQATFTVVLHAEPSHDVRVALSSSNPEEGTVAPAELTFTPVNWKAPQTVAVTGVDDDVADGEQEFQISVSFQSEDPAFAALAPATVTVRNTDNDSAGFTVGAASGPTTEAGGQASFMVVLNSQPRSGVTVHFASLDESEATLSLSELSFTTVNWNAPQTVLVTGVDDALADGNQPYEITFSATTSDDAAYAALTPANVSFSNTDDDSPGFVISPVSGPTTEAGGQASFTVALTSEPFADVTVNFASNDLGEGTLSASSLVFTAANWNAPQTVLATGVDDALADGNQQWAVAFSATTGDDAAYAALTPANVSFSNNDDDSAGIVVSAISGPTTEAGGQASFTVVLTSEPFADVTVNFGSNDVGEGTLSVSSLVFTPVNWNAPQTVLVSGVDDALADGNQPYAIAFTATGSSDAAYAALTPMNVAVSNTDNDSAGITVSSISGPTTEAGGQAVFAVVLTSEPFANVTVTFGSNDTTEGTVHPTGLTFTAANWNAPQTVTLTGVDDATADGNQPYAIVFSATTSTDAAYAAITPFNVNVTNTDNDSAGIAVSAVTGPTTEAGGQATFSVALTSEPFADVTVNLASSDLTEGMVSASSLTFTSANWNAPQTVTLTGVDDAVADGNHPWTVTFSATTSTDAAYAALTPANVVVSNTDNDSAGIVVSAVSGSTTEAGGQATFTLVLTSEPFADVTVNFASGDATEATVSPTSLTFDATNWSSPQTVTVTGVDDALADGAQPYAIVFASTTSTDAAYAAITPANVNLTNVDDDSAGFLVSAASGPTTEAGGQASFALVLTSQPFADVTVNFDSSDLSEGTVAVKALTFTQANWNVPQSVTVTGVDDGLLDGAQVYAIVFSATVSADPAYAALTPSNVTITNQDNDHLAFSGVMANIPVADLHGWTQCYSDNYAISGMPLSTILGTCNKAKLMLACRPVGSSTLTVAAWANRGDVTFDTGAARNGVTHSANGVGWYFNNNWSWGFAPMGIPVDKYSCDVDATAGGLKLCWHTGNASINGGYRCGVTMGLNGSTAYERLIFHAD